MVIGLSLLHSQELFKSGQNILPLFLGADQTEDQIILFGGDKQPSDGILTSDPIWQYTCGFRPTDAKRCDHGGQISVLIATHGAIYEVPYRREGKVIWAPTYPSCHSVEKLPDGNLVSASSNDHQLTIHYGPRSDGDKIKLANTFDLRFETAHGVVYDQQRQWLWAIGQVLGKFAYIAGPRPRLELIESFSLPHCHSDGHDLYPLPNGNLLITTHEAVVELPMGDFAHAIIRSELTDVKSAVADQKGHIFITDPQDMKGYETWQTDNIINLTSGSGLKRPGARFYKIRLWLPNTFSYR